ncbi:DsbA family protein [Endozoicomonas sp. 8E]|uniref:DsbA family protein n=1 Tax=Endozoicomonas sp. 8E TaxID=3035692 RepID=UPI002938F0DF|nr:DsbA family protein [Endozoicomonas sp. 8E]WOG29047.1 DsbA family protein [Endozoicomonas sp. 8E]
MKKTLILATTLLMGSLNIQAQSLDDQQKQEVRELVRKTLVENPDILVEAMNELRKREIAAQQNAEKQMLEARQKQLFENPENPIMGNPEASVTIAYFGDYNCGFCKRQDPILKKIVEENPDVKIVIKELPVLGPESREAAEMALATFKLDKDKYLSVNQRLMSRPGRHTSNSIKAALIAEGVDSDKLKVDESVTRQLEENLRLAQELGIRGTPALVFPNEVLRGYTEEGVLKEKIKQRL